MNKNVFVIATMMAFTTAPVQAQGLEFSGGVNFSELSGAAI